MSLAKCLYKYDCFPSFPYFAHRMEPKTLHCHVEDVKSRKRARIIIMFIPMVSGGLVTAQGLSNILYANEASPMSIISHVFNIYLFPHLLAYTYILEEKVFSCM